VASPSRQAGQTSVVAVTSRTSPSEWRSSVRPACFRGSIAAFVAVELNLCGLWCAHFPFTGGAYQLGVACQCRPLLAQARMLSHPRDRFEHSINTAGLSGADCRIWGDTTSMMPEYMVTRPQRRTLPSQSRTVSAGRHRPMSLEGAAGGVPAPALSPEAEARPTGSSAISGPKAHQSSRSTRTSSLRRHT
jgi:hypothetical protein